VTVLTNDYTRYNTSCYNYNVRSINSPTLSVTYMTLEYVSDTAFISVVVEDALTSVKAAVQYFNDVRGLENNIDPVCAYRQGLTARTE
jgi:hypothetical protein